MTILPLLAALVPQLPPAELVAPIRSVTVHPSRALVLRAGEVPPGDGRYVLTGLPTSLVEASVRVRAAGDEIVSVEISQALASRSPDEGVEAARSRVRELELARTDLQSRLDVERLTSEHLRGLLASQREPETQPADPADRIAAWQATLEFTGIRLREVLGAIAELERALETNAAELAAARADLGVLAGGDPVPVRELAIELLDLDGAPSAIEVEYLVGGASWAPAYDLRAVEDYGAVELVYRARVEQRTGEDWNDVELALSTAEVRRGTRGPEPQPVWVDLRGARGEQIRSLGYLEAEEPASDSAFKGTTSNVFASTAAIELSGLHVRYVVPRRETIPSRDRATTVLVGRDDLALLPERYAVPAADPGVWVRGLATNTSPFTLLPGRASVYVGSDFLGSADLEATQPGAELELPLGLDPRFTVEREPLEDTVKQPGVFGSRKTKLERWRVRLTSSADQVLVVHVQESLPRPRDSRIEVELDRSSVAPSTAERFAALREERGVLTFPLPVPAGGEAVLEWTSKIAYPEKEELVRYGG